ncbi:MAG TPA: zinc ribbon domain-containing protein [Bryobacteraceae bacterium]|nr:zinc ribbon domain-containing protein [Bryobacteraceae bacterium]
MPLYEYRCRKCGKIFEKLRRMQDADRELECPDCRSEEIERLLSKFATGGCGTSGSGPGRFT